METKRALVVIGTRPEAIKMAPVVHALAEHPALEPIVALTGQHTDLVDEALLIFGLEPRYSLALMREGQTVYDVVQGSITGLRHVIRKSHPDVLLVQGDTATVFAAALVGFLEQLPVGHVEAGLRSHNMRSPFPEEGFRHMTDVLANFYFAPTGRSAANLEREGVAPDRINVTGNTVIDALRFASDLTHEVEDSTLRGIINDDGRRLVLLTAHRRESFGAPLDEIFQAVKSIADAHEEVDIVYPVHPNPRVREQAEALRGHPRVHLVPPLRYLDMVAALRSADLILTDSGGIQEEAPAFGTPVIVLREVTERHEGLDAGVAHLVGTDASRIVGTAAKLLGEPAEERGNPYGDGHAGVRIADLLAHYLTDAPRETEDWDR